ncbi:MAG: hypothetical protein OEY77_00135 [Nitrospira sp.]|nr:hypothetical protein [Nitrospira sp.]
MTTQGETNPDTDELALGVGGKTLTIRGSYTVMIIIVLALAIFVSWMLWDSVSNGTERALTGALKEHRVDTATEHREMKIAIEAQTEVMKGQSQLQEEQNYLLFFATPKEKEKLSEVVRMPERFRQLLRYKQEHETR